MSCCRCFHAGRFARPSFSILISALLAMMALAPGSGRAASEAPITATLSVQGTPAAGGQCTVLWTGLPGITPESAQITFYLRQPGQAGEVASSQPLALAQNRTAQAAWRFALPSPGIYKVSALARLSVAGGVLADEASLTLDVPAMGQATVVRERAALGSELPPAKGKTPPAQAPLAASTGSFTVSGTFQYLDKVYTTAGFTGATQAVPVRRAIVDLLEKNADGTYTKLASYKTDNAGSFLIGVPNNVDSDGTGRDIAVRVWAESAGVRVEALNGLAYASTTDIVNDWAGGNMDIGLRTIGDSVGTAVYNIHEALRAGYEFAGGYTVGTLPQVKCRWAPGSTDGTHYDRTNSRIDIAGTTADPDQYDDDVLLYMYGLFLNHRVSYTRHDPALAHYWTTHTNRQAAWAYGWAAFFSCAVRGSSLYIDNKEHGATVIDAELPTGAVTGEDCEGAVTAALWDMFDSRNDGADRMSDIFGHFWKIYTTYFNSLSECSLRTFIDGWDDYGYSYQAERQAILKERGISYYGVMPAVAIGGSSSLSIFKAGEVDWIYFTVSSAGYYIIDSLPGTLADSTLYLYGPGSRTTQIAVDYDSGTGSMARVVRYLEAGTYYVKIVGGTSTAVGTYSIKISSGPVIKSFVIAGGASSTASRMVTLNLTWSGTPAYVMISERADFSGAAWRSWASVIQYLIQSAGNGSKTIYVKLRDAAGAESKAASDTITLNEPITTLLVNGPTKTGSINAGGDQDWYSFTVAVAGTYIIQTWGSTLYDNKVYLYGPNSQTALKAQDDNSGLGYAGELILPLTAGTYYVQVTAATAQGSGTYSICVLRDPLILSLGINNGAVATSSRTVTLNNICTGKPVYYMASESPTFAGAAWKAWSAAPTFSITSSGSGTTKVVYFKVKDAAGVESQVMSRAIFLK